MLSILDAKALTDSNLIAFMRSQAYYGVESPLRLLDPARKELYIRLANANSVDDIRRLQGAIQAIEDVMDVLDNPQDYATRS
jgi:hypothetical protein